MTQPVKFLCPRCGGTDISVEATVRWDIPSQRWVLGHLNLRVPHCYSCEATVFDDMIEVELDLKDYAAMAQEGSLTPEQA
jgi:predicted RNA-binding Zn-ribbon protein involved in translation (DUF1610 family)